MMRHDDKGQCQTKSAAEGNNGTRASLVGWRGTFSSVQVLVVSRLSHAGSVSLSPSAFPLPVLAILARGEGHKEKGITQIERPS
jgi:hypothetical protein